MVVRSTKPLVPPLQNGDHLDADEFERRYHAMPPGTRAELINGVVYMASPVRAEYHGDPHSDLHSWISYYRAFTSVIKSSIAATIRASRLDQVQPDISLRIPTSQGGQAPIDADGYIAAGTELVCEVSASTVDYDLHDKRDLYVNKGVREYLVWRVLDDEIDWWVLNDGAYEPIKADENGIRKSTVFPGLWLDTAALLHGDLAAVFATVQKGVASPEHAEFVKRLSGPAS